MTICKVVLEIFKKSHAVFSLQRMDALVLDKLQAGNIRELFVYYVTHRRYIRKLAGYVPKNKEKNWRKNNRRDKWKERRARKQRPGHVYEWETIRCLGKSNVGYQ